MKTEILDMVPLHEMKSFTCFFWIEIDRTFLETPIICTLLGDLHEAVLCEVGEAARGEVLQPLTAGENPLNAVQTNGQMTLEIELEGLGVDAGLRHCRPHGEVLVLQQTTTVRRKGAPTMGGNLLVQHLQPQE